MNGKDFFTFALKEAWKYQFLTYPNPPVGCAIVKNGALLSIGAHQRAGTPHAEVIALKNAYLQQKPSTELESLTDSEKIHLFLIQNHNRMFNECEIYVTLEPCHHYGKTPPCSKLLHELKPKKVFIGMMDPNNKATGGAQYLSDQGIQTEVVDHKGCYDLIEPFIKWQKSKFVFFKIATTINGTYTGGYLSAPSTLDWVHRVRDKIDLIVVGGETIRVDRPTLDVRRIDGKAPDVLIYSNYKSFDETIPLFNVKKRNVYIEESLDRLDDYNFIMVEGGEGLYKVFQKYVDWKVFLLSPSLKKGKRLEVDESLENVYMQSGDDIILFTRCV